MWPSLLTFSGTVSHLSTCTFCSVSVFVEEEIDISLWMSIFQGLPPWAGREVFVFYSKCVSFDLDFSKEGE